MLLIIADFPVKVTAFLKSKMRAIPQLFAALHARQMPGGPGGLQIKTAGIAVDIQYLAGKIQTRTNF